MARLLVCLFLIVLTLTMTTCQEQVEKDGLNSLGFFIGEKSVTQLQIKKRTSEILAILNRPRYKNSQSTSNREYNTSPALRLPSTQFPCPKYICGRACQFGFKVNEKGCRTCSCNKKPTRCPIYRCRYCKNGYKINENGCQTCSCKEEPSKPTRVCPLYGCRRHCQYGFKLDSNGCRTCTCNEKPKPSTGCPQYRCRRHCPFGFKVYAKGCTTCACNEKPNTTSPKPITTKPAVLREYAPIKYFLRRPGKR